MKNNRIVVDLNKVQYAWKSWITLCGNYKRQFKPTEPTVHGQEFDCDAPSIRLVKVIGKDGIHFDNLECTLLERASHLKILDEWIPCVTFQITANHRLTYTGEKAEALWSAWNEKIFNKKGK